MYSFFKSSPKDILIDWLIERERDARETSMSCLLYAPRLEIKPTTQVCALTRGGTCNPLVHRMTLQPPEPWARPIRVLNTLCWEWHFPSAVFLPTNYSLCLSIIKTSSKFNLRDVLRNTRPALSKLCTSSQTIWVWKTVPAQKSLREMTTECHVLSWMECCIWKGHLEKPRDIWIKFKGGLVTVCLHIGSLTVTNVPNVTM